MARKPREVRGFVVKQETREVDPHTGVVSRFRKEISRIYHARSAAEEFLSLMRKQNPEGDFYVHEKSGIRHPRAELV